MRRCPTCDKVIDFDGDFLMVVLGKGVFCCEGCLDKFNDNPSQGEDLYSVDPNCEHDDRN